MRNGDDTTGPALQRIEAKLDRQDGRLAAIEARLDSIDTTLLDHGMRLAALAKHAEAMSQMIDAKLELLRLDLSALASDEARFAKIAVQTNTRHELDKIRAELEELGRRLDALERR